MTAWDEMVDGRGGVRPHWRSLLGTLAGLDRSKLAASLQREAEEGGELPVWQCDPIPLILPGAEFATLQNGLCQRARLLEAVLGDLYGAQRTVAEGVLPPALVYANPQFLRACRTGLPPRRPLLHVYAADLARGPDGQWRVLADRTTGAPGIGYARGTRQLLALAAPELFRSSPVRPLLPFFEAWQEALVQFADCGRDPVGGRDSLVAMLTPGVRDAHWPEHAALARELGCALVEARDLTVRDEPGHGAALFLKTLGGLRKVDTLLRRVAGDQLDPLETTAQTALGILGLLDAARGGAVRILNDPGASLLEAPAFGPFLPSLCRFLLSERLLLPAIPTLWLADAGAMQTLASGFRRWAMRPAFDAASPPIPLPELDRTARATLEEALAAAPWNWVGCSVPPPATSPCQGAAGLVPKPVVLRLFLMHDGADWQMMPGGVARVLPQGSHPDEALPADSMFKDVWVLEDEPASAPERPRRAPRRREPLKLPSRVADDLFWLGRYIERLNAQARLARAGLVRSVRGMLVAGEVAELRMLRHCLAQAGMNDTAGDWPAMIAAGMGRGGAVALGLEQILQLLGALRDRLTAETYRVLTHAVRAAQAESGEGVLLQAITAAELVGPVVAGLVADGMVDDGGQRFLELGRRLERAILTARLLACVLDDPPERVEGALPLALKLCDSLLLYRSRISAPVQTRPVLDLILADTQNKRALGFQFAQASALLESAGDLALSGAPERLRVRSERIATGAVGAVAPALLKLAAEADALSDLVSRRFFALLPVSRDAGLAVA